LWKHSRFFRFLQPNNLLIFKQQMNH
jgi:hypothetical protein